MARWASRTASKRSAPTASAGGDFLPGLAGRDRSLVHYFAIYPNLLLTLHPDYMMTVTIWPQDCGRTKLIAEWHFHPDEMAKPDFVFEDAVEFWDRTNREDWAISEQSYLGISSRGYVPGPVLRARDSSCGSSISSFCQTERAHRAQFPCS